MENFNSLKNRSQDLGKNQDPEGIIYTPETVGKKHDRTNLLRQNKLERKPAIIHTILVPGRFKWLQRYHKSKHKIQLLRPGEFTMSKMH